MHVAFGSDGYRGVIGHTFTREHVARIVLGALDLVRGQDPELARPKVPIGYDTRFLSAEMAQFAARLLKSEGAVPMLANRPCPSPYLAFAVNHLQAPIGLQFTASHNSPRYLGIKLKGTNGGSLVPRHVELLEFYANNVAAERYGGQALIAGPGKLRRFDVDKDYRKALAKAAGWKGDNELPVLVDYMYGTGAGIYREILGGHVRLTTELHARPDPLFGGGKPEPLAGNLPDLLHAVQYDGHKSVGLAFDGDGDRLGVVDEKGRLLQSHEIFCLLLEHVARREQPEEGIVITSISFSGLVERVARAHNLAVYEVPVGFKNITEAMQQYNALMGGEESGGTGFGFYLPERDALLMALLLLAARQQAGTTLQEMVDSLYARFGRPVFISYNLPRPPEVEPLDLRQRLRVLADMQKLAGDEVTGFNHKDGMKVKTAQGWALLRPSGTEPLIRVYAEAESRRQARAYANSTLEYAGLPLLPEDAGEPG